MGAFPTCLLLIVLPVVTWCNGETLYNLQAFYEANVRNYQIATDETASYLSEGEFVNKLVAGSLEKFQQAGYVSEIISLLLI